MLCFKEHHQECGNTAGRIQNICKLLQAEETIEAKAEKNSKEVNKAIEKWGWGNTRL